MNYTNYIRKQNLIRCNLKPGDLCVLSRETWESISSKMLSPAEPVLYCNHWRNGSPDDTLHRPLIKVPVESVVLVLEVKDYYLETEVAFCVVLFEEQKIWMPIAYLSKIADSTVKNNEFHSNQG